MNRDFKGPRGRLHLFQCSFDCSCHFKRIRAVLARNDEDRAGSPLDCGGSNHRFRTLRNGRNIFQTHAASIFVAQHNIAELLRRKLLAFGPKDDALIRRIHKAGASNTCRSSGGVEHVINGYSKLQQPVRADLDLKLANLSTEDDDLGDTRYGEQTRAKRPICKSPDFHQRTLLGCETDLKHIARRRRERCHRWRPGTLRNARSDFHEPLADHLAGLKYVRAFRKDGGDDRKSLDRLRADRFQMRNAVHHGLNRPGHQLFHLFRR